jgi:mRNA interferase MazF
MRRGEVWFAATPGGDRPVLVLTRDPVGARIGAVVVAALTRTERGLVSELKLSRERDGVPTDCVVSFDNLHTVPRESLRHAVPSATLTVADDAEPVGPPPAASAAYLPLNPEPQNRLSFMGP